MCAAPKLRSDCAQLRAELEEAEQVLSKANAHDRLQSKRMALLLIEANELEQAMRARNGTESLRSKEDSGRPTIPIKRAKGRT